MSRVPGAIIDLHIFFTLVALSRDFHFDKPPGCYRPEAKDSIPLSVVMLYTNHWVKRENSVSCITDQNPEIEPLHDSRCKTIL